jgi:hypothetical protein
MIIPIPALLELASQPASTFALTSPTPGAAQVLGAVEPSCGIGPVRVIGAFPLASTCEIGAEEKESR